MLILLCTSLTTSYEFDGVSNPGEQCSFVALSGVEIHREDL